MGLPDLQECRSDFYESIDNAGMFWKVPTIQAFHSVVPGSVMEFYDSIGVQRDVASRPETSHYGLRGLTSVHWLFDDDHDGDFFAGEDSAEPAMPGWAYYGNANGFDIWENQYYIPMGFSYDYYITRSEYEQLGKGSDTTVGDRELAMLRAIVLEDGDVPQYGGLLEHLPSGLQVFTKDGYFEDCLDRAASACQGFAYTRTGFSATLDTQTEELVFFSIPYEPGWSATVNGEPAPIVRANVGFMAVVAPVGEQVQIEFTYRTPGLVAGACVALLSAALLVGYLFLARRLKGKPAPSGPRLMRPGRFSEYAKKRGASFLRPGAMSPRVSRTPALPPDPPTTLPLVGPSQGKGPAPVEYVDSLAPAGGAASLGDEALAPAGGAADLGDEAPSPAGGAASLGDEALAPAGGAASLGDEAPAPAGGAAELGDEAPSPAGGAASLEEGESEQKQEEPAP